MKKNTFYHSQKPKRYYIDLVEERPKLIDITLPNNIFWWKYRPIFIFRFPAIILMSLYFLLRWDKYDTYEKKIIKEDYFRDYWKRQRKKFWIIYPHNRPDA